MNRKFFVLPMVLLFAAMISVAGCGSNEAAFEETESPDATQEAEAEDYMESMEADQQRMRENYK